MACLRVIAALATLALAAASLSTSAPRATSSASTTRTDTATTAAVRSVAMGGAFDGGGGADAKAYANATKSGGEMGKSGAEDGGGAGSTTTKTFSNDNKQPANTAPIVGAARGGTTPAVWYASDCIPMRGASIACGVATTVVVGDEDGPEAADRSDRRLLARRSDPREAARRRRLATSTCAGSGGAGCWKGTVKNVYSTKAAYYKLESRCSTVCVYSWCCCSYSWGKELKCSSYNKYNSAVTTKTGEVCDCLPCPAGRYGADGYNCADCGVGYYCTGGSARVQCAAGNHQASTTASASTSCEACRAGYSCGGFTESICKVRGGTGGVGGGVGGELVAVCVGHMCTYFAP